MVLLEGLGILAQSYNYDDSTSRFLNALSLCELCIVQSSKTYFTKQLVSFFQAQKHALVFWRGQFSTVPELQSPWSAAAHIIQPDTKSKASTWYNSDLAKWLNKKNIQETVRQLKDSVLLIIYVMYVIVNNWNCENTLK